MAFTHTQLDTLEAAIAGGTLTVKFADRLVTYQTLNDMVKLRNLMRQELGLSSAAGLGGRIVYPVTGKGL